MCLEGQGEAQSSLLWMGLCSNVRLAMEKAVYTRGYLVETGIADDISKKGIFLQNMPALFSVPCCYST